MIKEISYSIVIPAYNEKNNIRPTAEGILTSFHSMKSKLEILFVDDNSPDGTAEEVNKLSLEYPQVKLIQHGKKEGIGAAHLAGYKSAKGEYILCMDADLSQSPNDLLLMKDELDNGYDLVIGSRYISGGQQLGKSFFREIGSKGMNFICRFVLGTKLADCTHTFRAFRKTIFEDISSKLDQKGHPNFQIQFLFWVLQKGFKTVEIPIIFTERDIEGGVSKISVKKEVPSFLKFISKLMIKRISIGRN